MPYKKLITTCNPQVNATVEHVHQTARNMIRTAGIKDKDDVDSQFGFSKKSCLQFGEQSIPPSTPPCKPRLCNWCSGMMPHLTSQHKQTGNSFTSGINTVQTCKETALTIRDNLMGRVAVVRRLLFCCFFADYSHVLSTTRD